MHARRLAAQLLTGTPAATAVDVAHRLLAVQGQDPRGARLAVRARSSGLHSSAIDGALTEDRSLLITWLNRGTLHLVRTEDYWWLHPLTTPQLLTGNVRRLAQEGVSSTAAERGVATVTQALADDGPLTRLELRERVAAAGVRVEGQALVHILVLSALRGLTVRGPMKGGHHAFVLVEDWLGPRPEPLDRAAALAELARRYLSGHGPAAESDLARWAGIPLGQARQGFAAIRAETEPVGDGLVDLTDRPMTTALPPPKLLGPFDPVLLGWTSRADVLGPHQSLVTVNGLFRPFALVRGKAVATWRFAGGAVTVEPLEPISTTVLAALNKDATAVEAFLAPDR
ncbi:MAG: hypothetical protein QOJ90_2770 [Actinomycetota bacterium]|nr:hypothetical protein [Actinomycetota bacterium]